MLKLGEIDFGPTDARHIIFSSNRDQDIFKHIYLKPANVNISKLIDGRRSIVYGIKGSGKSALLKYIELTIKDSNKSRFFYFRRETDKFFDHISGSTEFENAITGVDNLKKTNLYDFWLSFLLLAVANEISEERDLASRQYVSLVKKIYQRNRRWFDALAKQVPVLSRFIVKIGKESHAEIEGNFIVKDSIPANSTDLIRILAERGSESRLYLFFDEMEISFSTEERFTYEVALISSLIQVIRDMNEELRKCDAKVFIIAAIRREISDQILGGDISKIINDLGEEVAWSRRSWSRADKNFVHPLFEIAIRRIAFSEDSGRDELSESARLKIISERFPSHISSGNSISSTQKDILDLTMYRPRDVALLLGIAAKADADYVSFRRETLAVDVLHPYSTRMWVDIREALNSKYPKKTIDGIKSILSSLSGQFEIQDFFKSLDDFSYDPNLSDIIDKGPDFWIGILKDLFALGAVGNLKEDGKFRFRFRGQDELIIKRGQPILIHQALRSALT